MKKVNWEHTFRLNIWMLKATGLWPPGKGSYESSIIYTIYAATMFICLHIGFISFQAINLYFIRDDLKAVTETIFILMTDIEASLKACGIMKNMKILKQLAAAASCDLFQPKNIQQRNLLKPAVRSWKTIVFYLWLCAGGWLILCALFPILDGSSKDYRLPFLAWYPYNIRTSPHYELTYIYQSVAINFLATANGAADGLIAALNVCIGGQLDILADDLRNLRNREDTSPTVNEKLINCVHRHREILKFGNTANSFYNWLLIVQFFVSGVSIGLSMFQLTVVVPFSSRFYALIFFSTCIVIQTFFYCWFGNEVAVKSRKLHYAIFECDWINLSKEVKNNLIFLGLQFQNALELSAFRLFFLSLETFKNILRTAYSYFALLHQVNTRP